ncbi:MAG: GPW/gp25 family protein [Acidobacteriota bacterium]
MALRFPYQITGAGRTAVSGPQQRVRELVEQVLFTVPGERVNRPSFGSGMERLVFGAASPEVVTATQSLVQSSLVEWLGDVVQVEDVAVSVDESRLEVTVTYVMLVDQQRRQEVFEREIKSL